jgi:hypothetical protein
MAASVTSVVLAFGGGVRLRQKLVEKIIQLFLGSLTDEVQMLSQFGKAHGYAASRRRIVQRITETAIAAPITTAEGP